MSVINYCSDVSLGEHILNDCGLERQGGADAVLLLALGHQLTNPSSGVQINAEIAAGRAILLENIGFSFDYPSPVTVDSVIPCSPARLVTMDNTAEILDQNVNPSNVTVYDGLNGRVFGGLIAFECGNEEAPKVHYVNKTISVVASRNLPTNNNEFQTFKVSLAWKSKTMPSIHDFPLSVLGQ